jgi:TPR repeat protein
MNKSLNFLLTFIFLFLFSCSSVVFGGEMQDGFDAYNRKDFKEAVRFFRYSSEQGDALAQVLLGLMYDEGKGVTQDYIEAVKWYRHSAELGNASAQSNLGLMYAEGQGVLQDYLLAHMWFNFASSNGSINGLEGLKMIEKKLSSSQIEKAQEMARNWKPTKK